MKHLWHLLSADLVRHRLLIALWLFVVAADRLAIGVTPLAAVNARAAMTAGVLNLAISLAYLVLLVGIVPIVIQTHPLVGTDAFWMTRPIRPATLFVEKAILLGTLLVALPVAGDVVLMLAHTVPPGRLVAVASQGVLFKSLWLLVFATIASVTSSLSRFALVTGGLLAAMVAVTGTMLAVDLSRMGDDVPGIGGGEPTGDQTSVLVLALLFVAACALGLFVQFVTRRRARSIVVAGLGVCLAFVVSDHWPWHLLAWSPAAPEWTQAKDSLRLSSDPRLAKMTRYSAVRSARSWRMVLSPIDVDGIEPGWEAQVNLRNASWSVDNHVQWTSPGSISHQPLRLDHLDQSSASIASRAALGVTRIIGAPAGAGVATLVVLDEQTWNSLPTSNGVYSSPVAVRLTQYETEAVLPLAADVRYQTGAHRLAIDGVNRRATGVSVLVRISDAGSIFSHHDILQRFYYLRNRSTAEAVSVFVEPADVSSLQLLPFRQMSFGGQSDGPSWGFAVGSWWLNAEDVVQPGAPPWRITDAWLQHAELVVIAARERGSVERTLTVDDFPIRLAPELQSN